MFSKLRASAAAWLLLAATIAAADDAGYDLTGHTKLRVVAASFPDDSIFRQSIGSESVNVEGDLRLNFATSRAGWHFATAYQLFALHGDSVMSTGDDRRLFNLADTILQRDDAAVSQRLDRLWIAYANEKTVIRFGRQALTWGNGLFYAPMDLVNPFDPAAIDTEFKSGDDMLYAQFLRNNGNDFQGAVVVRRDPQSRDVVADQATVALKYHAFAGSTELDMLVADHYDDTVVGAGASRDIGGALWRGDLVVTLTPDESYVQLVTNLSFSWVWGGRNVSGAIEYFFNGFGQHRGEYGALDIASNPDLASRLSRGELFTPGRNYIAGSLLIELTPLWTVTPTVLANVSDPSALLQLVTSYSLSDSVTLLGSVNLPAGASGSEFGGAETEVAGLYRSADWGVFAQLAWYF